jgi:hypothetical protein
MSYRPEYMEDSVLDGSFLDIKERNVVEVLDMKVRQLKKKNDILMGENDNLRTELKLLCAADQDIQNDFTNSNPSNSILLKSVLPYSRNC